MIGEKFGKLLVIEREERKCKKNSYWICECECGRRKSVRRNHLLSGETKSCAEYPCQKRYFTHGHAGKVTSTEFRIWSTMKSRCTNTNDQAYESYGGRGITVSNDWMSFEAFLEDMGERPSERHTLERIDNNAGYSVDNCKWATWETQNRKNKRINKNNTSGARGVYLNKKTGSWYALIYVNKKHINLGTYKSFEDAVIARKAAEDKYWNEPS